MLQFVDKKSTPLLMTCLNFVQLLGHWEWVELHQTYVGDWAQTAAEASQGAQTQDKTERGEYRLSAHLSK